ncbi:hypothetical protein GIB67_022171 [Kingdonia uniflora]|uniref:Uncharacterized protein n=1 Tax=Kingdonia uniflora TaxID=39325 RepID=A0A7J7N8Z0_9MAGN|nr:hypothetical protein GIB67_022171 [Kingdonia uniflora]
MCLGFRLFDLNWFRFISTEIQDLKSTVVISSHKMAEEHGYQAAAKGHLLCANNCGFFGSSSTMNQCSKCFCDFSLNQQQNSSAKTAVEKSLAAPSSSSFSSLPFRFVNDRDDSITNATVTTAKLLELQTVAVSTVESQPKNRCSTCRKRVGLTGFKCRCWVTFCSSHRYPEMHDCEYDFKAKGKEAIAKCVMCYLEGHSPDSFPWLYTKCWFPHCDGIRKLMTSYTTKNYNKKYLMYQHSKCNEFQWLSDVNVQSRSSVRTSSRSGCFRCGGSSHWIRDFPWKESKCEVHGCVGTRMLKTSRQDHSYGHKYLKYFTCDNFQWLKATLGDFKEGNNGKLNVKVTVEMGLDELLRSLK